MSMILKIFSAGLSIVLFSVLIFTFSISSIDLPEVEIMQRYGNLYAGQSSAQTVDQFEASAQMQGNKIELTGSDNDANPLVLTFPVQGKDVTEVRSESKYGWRTISGSTEFHRGVDLSTTPKKGSDIVSSTHGIVTVSCHGCGKNASSYGNWVEVKDSRSGYKYRYAHLHSRNVKAGDTVLPGQKLGVIGNTGRSFGEHLHFEVIVEDAKEAFKLFDVSEINNGRVDPFDPRLKYDSKTKPNGLNPAGTHGHLVPWTSGSEE